MRILIMRSALALAVIGTNVAAQPEQGDVVMLRLNARRYDVLTAKPGGGAATTLRRVAGSFHGGPAVRYGNGGVVFFEPGRLMELTSAGRYTTLATGIPTTNQGNSIVVDQDGYYVYSTFNYTFRQSTVWRISPYGTNQTRLAWVSRKIQSMCRDHETGHFAALLGSHDIVQIDRTSGRLTTLARVAAMGDTTGSLTYVPSRDAFAFTRQHDRGTWWDLVLVRRSGSVIWQRSTSMSLGAPSALTFDDRSETFHAATSSGYVHRLDVNGRRLGYRRYSTDAIFGIEIQDRRNISVSTTGGSGAFAVATASFPTARSERYYLALSRGQRPGQTIGSERWNIALDDLFWASYATWPGFSGRLNGAGRAVAGFRLPSLLRGSRVYVTGVAWSAVNGRWQVGNTASVRIN